MIRNTLYTRPVGIGCRVSETPPSNTVKDQPPTLTHPVKPKTQTTNDFQTYLDNALKNL